ncbi:hypothetical protein BDF22DRAFT_91277 [Syncephalis plumigaleata]|nr:hypothetical protein BDF22DRAFT_91277 [Syncephalis plumigaleata]
MSQETQQALTKLAWLSVMGFITFLLQAIANFISGPIDNLTSVSVAVINYTFLTMAFTIRSVAIIMILGVRVPKHLREAGGTSGIVSSTGEPANNHSFADTEGKRYGAETLQAKMFFIQTYSPTYSPAYYHHNEAQRFSVNLAPDPLDNQYQHH